MKAEGLLRTQRLLGRSWAFVPCPLSLPGPSKKVLCSGLGSNLDHESKRRQTTASWDYQGNLRKMRKGLNRSLV